jgi:hypothetical protein
MDSPLANYVVLENTKIKVDSSIAKNVPLVDIKLKVGNKVAICVLLVDIRLFMEVQTNVHCGVTLVKNKQTLQHLVKIAP